MNKIHYRVVLDVFTKEDYGFDGSAFITEAIQGALDSEDLAEVFAGERRISECNAQVESISVTDSR